VIKTAPKVAAGAKKLWVNVGKQTAVRCQLIRCNAAMAASMAMAAYRVAWPLDAKPCRQNALDAHCAGIITPHGH
jgi:hypothetical protein